MKNIKIKTRAEKGITLVALIITVAILMILATVAIDSIKNQGIISHAGNAVENFTQKQDEEESTLDGYEALLDNIVNPVKLISFTIDGVDYQAEEGMTWAQWAESAYDADDEYFVDGDGTLYVINRQRNRPVLCPTECSPINVNNVCGQCFCESDHGTEGYTTSG